MTSTKLDDAVKKTERFQLLVLCVALICLICLSIGFDYVFHAGQARQTGAFLNPLIQQGEFRTVSQVLEMSRGRNFRSIQFVSREDGINFTLPPVIERGDLSLWERVSGSHIEVLTSAAQSSTGHSKLIFEYNRFSSVPYAVGVWFIIILFSIIPTRIIKKRFKNEFEQDLKTQNELLRASLAKTVRHNIRNPLAALDTLSETVRGLKSDELALFQSILGQLRRTLSELDEKTPGQAETKSDPIYDCVRDAFRELKLSLPKNIDLSLDLEESVLSAKVRYVYHEFRSTITNLCQNSKEAINGNGEIQISVSDRGDKAIISVKDTGSGIPAGLIDKVTEKDVTTKASGSGLGLYLASEQAKQWGGRLVIESTEGVGTTISIHLPIADRASWYLPRVKLYEDDTIVVVDDQVSVHRLWDLRLNEQGFTGHRHYFYSGEEADQCGALLELDPQHAHVFMDQDLGDGQAPGLTVLTTQFTGWQRYLVTGNFDDREVRVSCEEQSIPLLPKTELARIPIVICSRA